MQASNPHGYCISLVAPEGFEPPTFWFVVFQALYIVVKTKIVILYVVLYVK